MTGQAMTAEDHRAGEDVAALHRRIAKLDNSWVEEFGPIHWEALDQANDEPTTTMGGICLAASACCGCEGSPG